MATLAARRATRKPFALGPKSRAKWSPENDPEVVVTYKGPSLDLREAIEGELKDGGLTPATSSRIWRELVVSIDGLTGPEGEAFALDWEGGHLTDDSLAAIPTEWRTEFWIAVLAQCRLTPAEKLDLG